MAICISHYALIAPTGDQDLALYCACQAGLPAWQANREHTAPDPGSGKPSPLMLARLPMEMEAPPFQPERLLPLLDEFIQSNAHVLQGSKILLCLPAQHHARHETLNRSIFPWLKQQLTETSGLTDITLTDAEHLPQALTTQVDDLMAGEIPALTLIGFDSLLNEATLFERLPNNDIRTSTWAHGRVLSEAMAVIRFQNGDTSHPGSLSCTGLAHDRDDNQSRPKALARAARKATDAGDSVPRPHRLVLARAQQQKDELHWYHTHTDLWPIRLSARDNLAMRKGEKIAPQPQMPRPLHILRPALTLGDTGAASLPLALITACEALRFPHAPAQTALVLDSPGDGQQFAIHLQHTLPSQRERTPQ